MQLIDAVRRKFWRYHCFVKLGAVDISSDLDDSVHHEMPIAPGALLFAHSVTIISIHSDSNGSNGNDTYCGNCCGNCCAVKQTDFATSSMSRLRFW
jgi:hypothetical protein